MTCLTRFETRERIQRQLKEVDAEGSLSDKVRGSIVGVKDGRLDDARIKPSVIGGAPAQTTEFTYTLHV